MGVSLAMLTLVANAQTQVNHDLYRGGKFSGTLGANNFRNLPDAQIKAIGQRVSANMYPTKATAKQLLKASNDRKAGSVRKVSELFHTNMLSANYVSSDTLFWESFEQWDGETMPFIPSNLNKWSTKSNIANIAPYLSNNLCPTWTAYSGDGYYVPYATSGDVMLVCMYGGEAYGTDGSTVIAPAPEQDEWIVSPTITGIKKSNYLSFDICYSPWNTHYFIEGKDSLFDMERVAYDVEVLVTTSTRSVSYKDTDYTKVYKLSEVVDKEIANVDMNNNEEVGKLLYMKWNHVQIPLSEYDGKNIRIAFRYTGTKGGSILIDAVRVSNLLPVAKYDIPKGAFYWGFSDQMYTLTTDQNPVKFASIPAYVPSVWNNLSNEDGQSYVWSYSLDGVNTAQSNDYDLKMPACAPASMLSMPTLKANADVHSDEILMGTFSVGGNSQVVFQNGQVVNYNLGNYDLTKSWWAAEIGTPGSQQYAFGTGSGSFWAANSNYRYNNVDGIANYYEKPLAPYVFNEVTLPLGDYLNFGATLACTIYKVDAEGFVSDEIIAQSVYNPNASKPKGSCTNVPGTSGMYCLKFLFDDAIVIDEPIFICIDGFNNSNMMSIAPIAQAMNHDNGIGYAFVKLNTQKDGYSFVEVAGALASVDGGSNMNVSHCIGLNAVFPYLHSKGGNVFASPSEGGSKEFAIDTYWEPKDWKITTSASWIKAEPIVDEVNQVASVKITVDALPAGVESLDGTVTISALGCEETIIVLQGAAVTGIGNVLSGNAVGGIFTLSGQRINSADAKNGIFIEKKNGKFVKVIK